MTANLDKLHTTAVESPQRSIIYEPELFIYIKDFGSKPGDFGVVAEQDGQLIGAAWTRIINAYGHINDDTPELAVSVFPSLSAFSRRPPPVKNARAHENPSAGGWPD